MQCSLKLTYCHRWEKDTTDLPLVTVVACALVTMMMEGPHFFHGFQFYKHKNMYKRNSISNTTYLTQSQIRRPKIM